MSNFVIRHSYCHNASTSLKRLGVHVRFVLSQPTAEQALVSKTARVVEEVALRKIGSDHVETVHDKIRRQQVEIERLGADGRPLTPTRP